MSRIIARAAPYDTDNVGGRQSSKGNSMLGKEIITGRITGLSQNLSYISLEMQNEAPISQAVSATS